MTFCRTKCDIFDGEDEENKLEYTAVFQEWCQLIEAKISERLAPLGVTLAQLTELLSKHPQASDGEIFEFLLSLSDFSEFRELMLAFKQEKQGLGPAIACVPAHIYEDEQEDGDARPDLDLFAPTVTSVNK